MTTVDLDALAWPTARLSEALETLARQAGLPHCVAAEGGAIDEIVDDLQGSIERSAARLGLAAEGVSTPVPDYADLLRCAGPAVLGWPTAHDTRLLLLLRRQGARVVLLAPNGRRREVAIGSLRDSLCRGEESAVASEIAALLAHVELSPRRRDRARVAMLRNRLQGEFKSGCWLLRLPPEAKFGHQLSRERLPLRLFGIAAVFAAMYALELSAWSLMGNAALGGRWDAGWFMAWCLLVASLVPLDALSAWCNAMFCLDAGRLLKQRLLAGVLRMDTQTLRQQGAGQLLGRVIESQALESLALGGGFAALQAVVELTFAAWVLSVGTGGGPQVLTLLAWLLLTLGLGWRYGRRLRTWTDARLGLTHELIERMSGHRTCLVQEPAARRVEAQDRALDAFLTESHAMDRAAVPLSECLARGWLMVGILGLAPGFIATAANPASAAVGLGGVLLAARAFGRVAAGMTALARAGVAWQRVAEIFRAGAAERGDAGAAVPDPRPLPLGATVLETQGLAFRHQAFDPPLLDGVDLTIRRGDRILLEGPSGGGKSTLASVLVGLREASAGLLLLRGLDRASLGREWRRHAAAAPQFHENHILSGSLAFNLLMGRRWPAAPADLAEAEALCRDLGLGELLDRMPSGLMQTVGETGWQLSHGERSRIYLARALLQSADFTVLDESFAALDPASLKQCLDCALQRSDTLMVIAHP